MSSTRTPHPLLIIAALSLIILSLTGVAAMMGWLPNSHSQPEATLAPKAVEQDVGATAKGKAETAAAVPAPAKAPHRLAAGEAKTVPVEPPHKHAPVCADCGVVEAVKVVEVEGQASGLGAIAGGVAGGILGHQIGQGRGNTVATVAGVAGGAFAGHEVEKRMKKTRHYDVHLRMEDGSTRVLRQETDPGLGIGQKVRIENGVIVPE